MNLGFYEKMKLDRKILAFLFTIVLFNFIGLTLLITVQAFIVREYNTTALAVSLLFFMMLFNLMLLI